MSLSYIFQGGAPVNYVRPSYFIIINGGHYDYSTADSIIDVRVQVINASGTTVTFTISSQESTSTSGGSFCFYLVIYNPQFFNTASRKIAFDVNINLKFYSESSSTQNIYSPLQQNQFFPYLEYFSFGNAFNLDFDISAYSSGYIYTRCSARSTIALRFLKIITQSCANSRPYFYNDLCYSSCPTRTRLVTSSSSC